MENTKKLLGIAVYGVLFCAAIAYLFRGSERIHDLQTEIKKRMNNEVGYEKPVQTREIVISKGEIIAALLVKELEYDIQIENLSINRVDFNTLDVQNYIKGIWDNRYRKEYVYNAYGEIVKVVYRSL